MRSKYWHVHSLTRWQSLEAKSCSFTNMMTDLGSKQLFPQLGASWVWGGQTEGILKMVERWLNSSVWSVWSPCACLCWGCRIEKPKALSLMLHTADISHPAKAWDLHHRWTMSLLEEFFRQVPCLLLLPMAGIGYFGNQIFWHLSGKDHRGFHYWGGVGVLMVV